MKRSRIVPSFVQYIPERLEPGVLYVSREYGTASHLCCCGCGEEVVTPLNPTDWALTIECGGVTLFPSVGNWSFACRSHYWIRNGDVEWAGPIEQWRIEQIRACDRARKDAYFRSSNESKTNKVEPLPGAPPRKAAGLTGWLEQIENWLKGWLP
jgi:hypothetical protein